MAFLRVSTRRHTANMNHVARTRVCRQGPCDGLTAIIVCCVPESGTRRTQIFAVCHMAGTRRTWFSRHAPSGPLLFVVCLGWHTANMDLCRVPGPRHMPKIMFAVCLSPAHGEHEKKFMFLLPNFFYTLHILFGTLCLNMIFL